MTDDFNPAEKAIKIQGGVLYLQVKDRLIWARKDHPNLCIRTQVVVLDEKIAAFQATASYVDEQNVQVVGMGHGSETPQGFPPGYIEKAETVAIGRALAALGYGTAAAFEEQEGGKLADSPVRRRTAGTVHDPDPTPPNYGTRVMNVSNQQAPSLTQRVRERPTPAQDALRPVVRVEPATDGQRKRLWALSFERWGKEKASTRMHQEMWERFELEHVNDLNKADISELMNAIESGNLLTEEPIPQEDAGPVEDQEMVVSELGWKLPAEPPHMDAALAGENRYTR
jgi:hypothetical protein